MRAVTSASSIVRRSGSGTEHHGHRAGVLGKSGPRRAVGPTRTAEGRRVGCVRVRVLVSSVSGRMASGLSPYGVASFVHARLGSI